MSSITSPHASGDITAPPDWQAIQQEVKCPLCDYNLRGLHEPRCPECGYQFDWPSVLDPNKRRHPYLFEHHPERNIRSFLQTLLRHLRPFEFWKTAQPTHHIRARRLIVYSLVCTAAVLLSAAVGITEVVRDRLRWMSPPPPRHLLQFVANALGRDGARLIILGVLLLTVFPWLNFAALMIFQQSMRRAKVKTGHVLRCAIYSGDVIFWYGLAAAITIACFGANLQPGVIQVLIVRFTFGFILVAAVNAVRLWVAYANYMQFKAALATVLAAQIIVGLTIFTVFMYVMTH